MEAIRCIDCTDVVAQECARNFQNTRDVLDAGVQATMDGAWSQLTIEDGRVVSRRVEPAQAMDANAIVRSIFVGGLYEMQQGIGCTLEADDIEAKLITT